MRNALFTSIVVLLAAAAEAQTIRCESVNEKYTECRAPAGGRVVLARQLSGMPCFEGTNWGTRDGMVWVGSGCGAEFIVYPSMASSSGESPVLTCESVNMQRNHCRANTSSGVSLLRQISGASCVHGRSWGVDRDGIWVDRGCRAEFVLD